MKKLFPLSLQRKNRKEENNLKDINRCTALKAVINSAFQPVNCSVWNDKCKNTNGTRNTIKISSKCVWSGL